jgi:hypothetical protein
MSDPTNKLLKHKAAILKALKSAKIGFVVIHYDGEGDSGQVHDILAYHRPDLLIPRKITNELREVLDAFAWAILDLYHDGFEISDGGCGEIKIDVAKRSVILDHNDRVTEFVNTMTEV